MLPAAVHDQGHVDTGAPDALARGANPGVAQLDLQARRELWRRDHPAHGGVEGPVLSLDREEHALDEGDAGPSAADQLASQQVSEGPPGAPARDAGALPEAPRESNGRLPADDRSDPYLLRALPGAVGVGRATGLAVPVLWTSLRLRSLDLRSGGARSDLRAARAHGYHDVRAAEDDADDGRSASGADDVVHAGHLHVHVPQPAVGPRPLLDRVQHPADPAAEAHGPTRAHARDA